MSFALGFASGVLLATVAFSMLPEALRLASLPIAVGGFSTGFLAMYAFDLFIHRGQLAGKEAEERPQVERFYTQSKPRGGEVTVLAGGTSVEELIEGLSIGVGAVIKPGLALLIALAIIIDNLAESLSIGEIIRSEGRRHKRPEARRILGWTGLIGLALLNSAMTGWFFLKGLPEPIIGFLFAVGGGGMLYLTISDLLPDAEERHYQESSAFALASGFILVFVLSQFLEDTMRARRVAVLVTSMNAHHARGSQTLFARLATATRWPD
jgi:ZIP family zinc transporter